MRRSGLGIRRRDESGGGGIGGGREGRETFYSLLRQSSPAYEKCMEQQSGTQLFAWLRGLERRMQPSSTHKHSRRSRGTIEAEEQQEDEPAERKEGWKEGNETRDEAGVS